MGADEQTTEDLYHSSDAPGPSAREHAWHRSGEAVGPYKLLELLGEGGFGEVWLAEQREPIARRVALKLIKAGMDSKAVIARFEQERQALALMDHPNIARVHDAGTTPNGRLYFVMEHVKGAPITDYCDKARLTITQRLELFSKVCDAVQHAHMKGIIHRDLKPSNILVTVGEGGAADKAGEARPVVIDFGVAKAVAARLTEKTIYTEQGHLIGTPEYMSPEQAEMAETDIDTRTDVYALGVILYELLTGALPFDPKSLRAAGHAAIQKMIREMDPPRPSTRLSSLGAEGSKIAEARRADVNELASNLRSELEWIPLKAMRKERTERYRTASELSDDIAHYLNHRPLIAGPESTAYRLKKFIRRNRIGVLAGVAVFAALLLGMAGTAWQFMEARTQARRADERAAAAETAQTAEHARADELEKVSDFQADMLAQVNPTEAGKRLTEDVANRFAEALKKAGVPDSQRAAEAAAFAEYWGRVNATDAARELIDTTILKPAVEAIDRQFKDQPAVDAQLRQVLAAQYRDLGLHAAAAPLQQAALETRRRVLGEDHRQTMFSISSTGILLQAQGRLAEAEGYFREAIEKSERVNGQDHPSTHSYLANLGSVLMAKGDLAGAETIYRETLDYSRRLNGEDHPATLTSLNNLGGLLAEQGKLAEAEPYWREALEKRRRVLGAEHRDTLDSINNLGYLFQAQGKLEEAEPYYREAVEKSRRALGEAHPRTLLCLNNLGTLLKALDRFAEAERCLSEVLEVRRRTLGGDHVDTLISLSNMGVIFMDQGRYVEAEPYSREALSKFQRVFGAEHANTIAAMVNVGRLLLEQGKFAEAEAVLLPGAPIAETALPRRHRTRLAVLELLSEMYDSWDKAEPGKGHDDKAAEWKAKLDALK